MISLDLARDIELESLKGGGVRQRKMEGEYGLFREDTTILGDEFEHVGIKAGRYVSIENVRDITSEEEFAYLSKVIGCALLDLIKLEKGNRVLVVGLGNREVLTDALGCGTLEKIIVTRHNHENLERELKRKIKCVSTISPLVEGVTGIKSNEVIKGVIAQTKPDYIIAVDALLASDVESVMNVIQISDTGIAPGSATRHDAENILSEKSLGIKVFAIGAPLSARRGKGDENFVVTPVAMEAETKKISRAIAYGINMALFNFLDFDDIKCFVH